MKKRLVPSSSQLIREMREKKPNITMQEAMNTLLEKHGRKVSPQTFYGVVSKDKLSREKAAGIPQIPIKRKKKFHHQKPQQPAPSIDAAVETEILRREVRKLKDIMMRVLMD